MLHSSQYLTTCPPYLVSSPLPLPRPLSMPLHAVGLVLAKVRALQPWADGKQVKAEVDAEVLLLLGPKTEADEAKPVKKKKEKKVRGEGEVGQVKSGSLCSGMCGAVAVLKGQSEAS